MFKGEKSQLLNILLFLFIVYLFKCSETIHLIKIKVNFLQARYVLFSYMFQHLRRQQMIHK